MVKFLIVRHGYSTANEKGIFAGILDAPLSQIGKEQGKLVSRYVLENHQIDAIYSSQLSRAQDTIRLVSESLDLPIIADPAFNEIHGGKWEGKTFEEIFKLYKTDLVTWREDIYNSKCTGGESFIEASKRTFSGLEKIAKISDGKTVLIATHACALRSLLTAINQLSAEDCAQMRWVSNASITTVIYENGKFKTTQIGYDEYLKSLKTQLPKNI